MARGDIHNEARVPRVLLGTADESYLKNVRRALQEAGYRVEVALDSETVMASLEPRRYDLAVLDTSLGKIDGLSVFDRLRTEPDGRVLYLIALVDSEESRPLDAPIGPDDCLTKPFEISDLLTSVHIASRIVTLQRELDFANHRISTLAMTDALTGLPNRQAIYEMLGTEIARQSRESPVSCVALIDIDRMREINDAYGRAGGDLAVLRVARTLRSSARDARRRGSSVGVLRRGCAGPGFLCGRDARRRARRPTHRQGARRQPRRSRSEVPRSLVLEPTETARNAAVVARGDQGLADFFADRRSHDQPAQRSSRRRLGESDPEHDHRAAAPAEPTQPVAR